MMMDEISFDGLDKKYANNSTRVLSAIDRALRTGKRLRSHLIDEFEVAVCPPQSARALAVSSGTTGLEITLRSMGIGPGDKVIVPAFSFAASAGCVLSVGAEPLFVDVAKEYPVIDSGMLTDMDIQDVKALIAVHLYGTIQPINPIVNFCRQNQISLIEDAAQAYGSYSVPEMICPEDSHAAILSFDPYKVLPGISGGGAIITKNTALSKKIEMIRCHGFSAPERDFIVGGTNAEMSSVDASVLLLEIEDFSKNNNIRSSIASRYAEAVRNCSGVSLVTDPVIEPNNHHKFVLLTLQREFFASFLKDRGVPTKIHYDRALPDYSLFHPFRNGDYPNARKFAESVLSLPIHPEMTEAQVSHVCNILRRWDHDYR